MAVVALLALGSWIDVNAEQESITRDSVTGNYIIIYLGTEGATQIWQRVVYVPATKIDPRLSSSFRHSHLATAIVYEFRLRNGRMAEQNINMLIMHGTRVKLDSFRAPRNWNAVAVPDFAGLEIRFSWAYEGEERFGGLGPGQTLSGFLVESEDLPGVAVAEVSGARESLGFPDEGPGEDNAIYPQFRELLATDFVARPAAAPKIPNPQPFDAAAVLTSLQKHIKEDIVTMKLIDPVFAAQLDRGLQAALDAAKRGNTAGLKGQLKELRLMLKGFGEPEEVDHSNAKDDTPEDQIKTKAWPHPISKLAARVIDFDLQYIERRVKE